MEIELKFFGLGINNNNQANVLIYDDLGNLIYDGQTYNGSLYICLNKNKAYRLIASICNEIIDTYFYVNNYKYNFYFNRSLLYLNNNSITLLLTDYNYKNLPIEKGELILWQK